MIPVDKLEAVLRRRSEIDDLMCDPKVIADSSRIQKLSRERSNILPLVDAFGTWQDTERKMRDARELLADPDFSAMAREELAELEARRTAVEEQLRVLLLPKDPNDDKNTLLEIRAGTGGEEAALFAADLFRMYGRFAETSGWKVEVLSSSDAAAGGLKEVVALVSGNRVYSRLKFEGGVHRVQRVPATEAQGRIHTSTATVAVLPEADDVEVQIDEKDLRYDIAASGGPGGQGVNTTNSAVQITHLPTGMIVKCQDERSQIKNRARALKILKSRLLDIAQREQSDAIRDERRDMVKGGERSEKIRTYNFPQNRITDHRVGLTLYKLDRVMEGDIGELVDALVSFNQAARINSEHGTDLVGSS
ncbi:MAG TPA: peptide chain release factor 1 [Polyangiaceae bacterium]|jgi:peptide chain release factor 1|nr:peptide chain release factor 1 [Polyangiaceae bacterium]